MTSPNNKPNQYDPNRIDASPTKDLFITMLIKDITVRDAIGDLIDNSVDAIKKNFGGQPNWSDYVIHVKVNKDFFEINDNGGGLEAEVARTSAFCFGKPKDYVPGVHSIGQFGIGMKRAFFKLGNNITVDSVSKTSAFKMHIDVPRWRELSLWDFAFDELSENQNNAASATRTDIKVTDLNSDIKEKFSDNQFIIDLKNEIALEQLYILNKGLKIFINE